ncbi:hypothetical protein D3C75_1110920 [compost metagenome]
MFPWLSLLFTLACACSNAWTVSKFPFLEATINAVSLLLFFTLGSIPASIYNCNAFWSLLPATLTKLSDVYGNDSLDKLSLAFSSLEAHPTSARDVASVATSPR